LYFAQITSMFSRLLRALPLCKTDIIPEFMCEHKT
jgi:hypothetical protein